MNRVLTYFRNFGLHQWVRLAFGLLFLGAFIYDQQWPYAVFSGVFLLQAFTNTGCRGDSCSI